MVTVEVQEAEPLPILHMQVLQALYQLDELLARKAPDGWHQQRVSLLFVLA